MLADTAPRPISLPLHAAGAAGASHGAAEVPAPILPGEHFAAALVCFVIGGVGLIAVAGDLAAGMFFLPRVIAVVHLFTLGWIMTSIFGALCQFLPVAIGRGLRWPGAAHASFAAHVTGVALFVGGLATGHPAAVHAGACGLAIGFGVFAVNLAVTLATVRDRGLTWWALAGVAVFLVVTPAYGVVLALNLRGGGLIGGSRFAVVAAHAHVAIAGVVLLTMVGVAHRLLPMFLLSHGARDHAAWTAIALLAGGAAVLAIPGGAGVRVELAGALIAGGVVAFLVQAVTFFHHRRRRSIDPGMQLAAAGLIGLAVAVLVAPIALSRGLRDLHLLTAYVTILLGAITLFVAGHYYKIVPFLVWYHRFGPLVGTRKVPTVAELYAAPLARLDGALLAIGWLGVAIGIFAGRGDLVRAAAVAVAAGAVLEAIIIARVARRRVA
ncbi:MAG: hypothetical protein H6708_33650 [Kofleriaceae bacterium]|nr:hypothetical protein [Myxococcales bacterium]MCB9565358.1 hypothetical protein [Kofleriaceae bacterium]